MKKSNEQNFEKELPDGYKQVFYINAKNKSKNTLMRDTGPEQFFYIP